MHLLSSTPNPDDREDIERALTAICRRNGARCLGDVLPLAKTGDATLRKVGLRALSSIGGGDALGIVTAAVNDPDETIQNEAVNLLSTWPNTWPDDAEVAEPLLTLAKSGKKPSYQVQGLRGYLQYIEENKKLSNEDKITKLNELLPFIKGPEQKRQAIAAVGTIPTAGALDLLMAMAKDQAVADEAYMAAVKIAADSKLKGATDDARRSSLQTIADKAENEATKKKANDALRKIR